MSESPQIVKQRRVVIVFQLGVLVFILAGLFSAAFLHSNQSATVQETVSLDTVTSRPVSDTTPVPSLADVQVRAKAAYVFDVQQQRALYSKNATQALPLASITKLMTALLAYELVTDDTTAAVSVRAVGQEGSNGLLPGETLTLKELSRLALISSSNDAAFALGASVGALLGDQDPEQQFIAGMNIRAKELQLDSLQFKNTTGLDLSVNEPGALGSAKDVSFLLEYLLKEHPELLESTTQGGARIYNTDGSYHDIENTNEVLYAIPNLLGSKTGYTDLAGGNLTIVFDAGLNRPIIITVLGSTRDERFSDVLRLVEAVQRSIVSL